MSRQNTIKGILKLIRKMNKRKLNIETIYTMAAIFFIVSFASIYFGPIVNCVSGGALFLLGILCLAVTHSDNKRNTARENRKNSNINEKGGLRK